MGEIRLEAEGPASKGMMHFRDPRTGKRVVTVHSDENGQLWLTIEDEGQEVIDRE